MNKMIYFLPFLLLVFICYQYWSGKRQNIKAQDNFRIFNESSIQGDLRYIGYKNHGIAFRVHNDSKTFVFWPHFAKRGKEEYNLINLAKVGDSIIKMQYSDTLYLLKPNGDIYSIDFMEPDNGN